MVLATFALGESMHLGECIIQDCTQLLKSSNISDNQRALLCLMLGLAYLKSNTPLLALKYFTESLDLLEVTDSHSSCIWKEAVGSLALTYEYLHKNKNAASMYRSILSWTSGNESDS